MTPLAMIAEWRKGCSCAGPFYDRMLGQPEGTTSPTECSDCTRSLINAIETYCKNNEGVEDDQKHFS